MRIRTLFLFLLASVSLILHLHCGTQRQSASGSWERVDTLLKQMLPASALKEVEAIYQQARMDNDEAEILKALIFRAALQEDTREDNLEISIREMESELSTLSPTASAILQSIIAERYHWYLQQNRYKLYDRTHTAKRPEDISEWSLQHLHERITSLYLSSIQNQNLLQNTSLESYDAIIIKGNVRLLRPTLFDLLAHRALNYFENTEREVTNALVKFEIDEAAAFSDAATFTAHQFETKDTASLHYKALQLYQQILGFHINSGNEGALIDADISRIVFVRRQAVMPEKDSLYMRALEEIAASHPGHPQADQALFLLAAHYQQRGIGYEPYGDTSHRYDLLKAKELAEKVISQADSARSLGWANAFNLLNQLKAPSLTMNVEQVNIPNLPFRAFIQYRNIDELNLRIIRADSTHFIDTRTSAEIEKFVENSEAVRSWNQKLPNPGDLQQHAVEIKIDALPDGIYYLIADINDIDEYAKPNFRNRPLLFQVSNISYLSEGSDYFVLHRNTGQPLTDAQALVFENMYDSREQKNVRTLINSYRVDKNGHFIIAEPAERYRNISMSIRYADETFFAEPQYRYYQDYSKTDKIDEDDFTIHFFLDRSIYRPGQRVYFKGLVLNKTKDGPKPVEGLEDIVYLEDANGEDIDSLKLTTNEFGTFSGSFVLPENVLNGQFNIWSDEAEGEAYFSVEEYKRPRFEIELNLPEGTYEINDTINVTGKAMAYAGFSVSNAAVKYRVVRESRFPYPWLMRGWWPRSESAEILSGVTTTDASGNFAVSFPAIPDRDISRELKPVFNYRIEVDITDIAGETRTSTTSVEVSYEPFIVISRAPETLNTGTPLQLQLSTENLAGKFIPTKLNISIARLQTPQRLIRDRYWERPNQFLMSKEEYLGYFPYDEYDNEADPASWKEGANVYQKSVDSDSTGKLQLNDANLSPGVYRIHIRATAEGETIAVEYPLYVASPASGTPPLPLYLAAINAEASKPGDTAATTIMSAAENIFLIRELNRVNKPEQYSYHQLSGANGKFSIPVTEEDRGGINTSYAFVKHNRVHTHTELIHVPWSNKDLKIEYLSFRDKTLPGSEEEWRIRISGPKNESVAAELLASMYDASLDQFVHHEWQKPTVWPQAPWAGQWETGENFDEASVHNYWEGKRINFLKKYDNIILSNPYNTYGLESRAYGVVASKVSLQEVLLTANSPLQDTLAVMDTREDALNINETQVAPRRNFNETAFFFPQLRTDKDGTIEFSFKMPESVTRWKFQALAHTKELAMALSQKEIVTQKDLMVQPAMPRFLREGDRLELATRIVNITDRELTGQVELQLFDAKTMTPVDGWFQNLFPNQYFTVAAGGTELVAFPVEVPHQYGSALTWRIIARSGEHSDGEEAILPVLSNRILVTESLPLTMMGTGNRDFSFDKLLQSKNSSTLQHHALTVEYTANPAWYGVQSLPYLMEFPHECSEQVWNRFYANALAAKMVQSIPRLREVLEKWKITDTTALLSNLQKNEELKSALLAETPWVLEAKTETEQKKNIALLFDAVRMERELNAILRQLESMQHSNGSFPWFAGGRDDRYITQYIVTGIGRLQELDAWPEEESELMEKILANALGYLDVVTARDYNELVKSKAQLSEQQPGHLHLQYIYMRGLFDAPAGEAKTAYDYYVKQAAKYWTRYNKYLQGMTALALYRADETETASRILASLKETAVRNPELGMYWQTQRGWFWWQAPVETQSLLIEAFHEIENDTASVDAMRTWLLRQKQVNSWESTRATADAVYALLLRGTNWLNQEREVVISLGNYIVETVSADSEAGSGYMKKRIEGKDIRPEMGDISVSVTDSKNNNGSASWGAVYWQYFEEIDKVSSSQNSLQVERQLMIKRNTPNGPALSAVEDGELLKVGDRITVRITVRSDRDMEYLHLKDLRAAGMEPVDVISSWHYEGGMGYYQTTRDLATDFFISFLPRGTYVMEYDLHLTHSGQFSAGMASIQSMYAPEFGSHSEGRRVIVER